MSTQQLQSEAIQLPLRERISLAQALWESINHDLSDIDEGDALRKAIRRDKEMESGAVTGRTHEEVMRKARRAIGCG